MTREAFDPRNPVAVVSGASSGIGKETASALMRLGWQVIGIGRDPHRCGSAAVEIRAEARDDARLEFIQADFDLMSEVVRVAGTIRRMTTRVDALVNNAGGVRDHLVITEEGNEATFAVNHLAAFLLTRELLPVLAVTARNHSLQPRVISVSSNAHRMAEAFNWEDLQMLADREAFSPGAAYCLAKLANILFSRELARRTAHLGIIAQAMHPGVVATNFSSHGDDQLKSYMKGLEADSPDRPAQTLVWLATAPEAGRDGGRYFHNMAEEEPAPLALDAEAASKLWEESEALLRRMGY